MSIENVERFVMEAKTNAGLEKKLKDAVGIPAVGRGRQQARA